MGLAIEKPKKQWTEEELQKLPDDGYTYEVIHGELVTSPKNNFQHGTICTRLILALKIYNQTKRLGAVLDSSTGFWMQNRNCRAPDVSFILKSRLDALNFKPSSKAFFPGAPDLAVEIFSPTNSKAEIDDRITDFFSSGTRRAWIIHPDERFVEVCDSSVQRQLVGSGGFLEGGEILPGFRYPVADLFKEWDWE